MSKSQVQKLLRAKQLNEDQQSQLGDRFRKRFLIYRTLFLLQIPLSFCALVVCLQTWNNRQTAVIVPADPLPSIYQSSELPDWLFIDQANTFVNLIATYTSAVARRQFELASQSLTEPVLSRFNQEVIQEDLSIIEQTQRSQVFYTTPSQTQVTRKDEVVYVTLIGTREKSVKGDNTAPLRTRFVIKMKTVPQNKVNPYGIVITDYRMDQL